MTQVQYTINGNGQYASNDRESTITLAQVKESIDLSLQPTLQILEPDHFLMQQFELEYFAIVCDVHADCSKVSLHMQIHKRAVLNVGNINLERKKN